jgi:hypothetical protein
MSHEAYAPVARRVAVRLADLDSRLPADVDSELATDVLERAPTRVDPISLGSLLVSIVALGWQVYRDIKEDRKAKGQQRPITEDDVFQLLSAASELPPSVPQINRVIRVVAEEITVQMN